MKVNITVFDKVYPLEVDESEVEMLKLAEEKIEIEYLKRKEEGYSSKDCYCVASLLASFDIIKEKEKLKKEMLMLEDDMYMLSQSKQSESDDGFQEIAI